jgi:hypothetical protein
MTNSSPWKIPKVNGGFLWENHLFQWAIFDHFLMDLTYLVVAGGFLSWGHWDFTKTKVDPRGEGHQNRKIPH